MIDFTIVGQGLAGSMLAWELIQRGYQVEIWEQGSPNTSSMKAAGLYNPITGRKMVKTWMADALFENLESHYGFLESKLDAKFLHQIPIYRPFYSMEEQNDWAAKWQEETYDRFIAELTQPHSTAGIEDPYGGITLSRCGYVDLPEMLYAFRKYFIDKGVFFPKTFGAEVIPDGRVIFCDGTFFTKNLWWSHLPFRPVRGEILDIRCDLPADRIYNRGVFMLPKGDVFRVGSTYDHQVLTFEPQESGIQNLRERLTKLFSGDYELIRASAGVRPATQDRRPYIGWHPENKQVGIFNGFGTKGVSLVPYFSKLFVDSIEGKAGIHPEANVSRVL